MGKKISAYISGSSASAVSLNDYLLIDQKVTTVPITRVISASGLIQGYLGNNNIGIGTSTPAQLLHLSATNPYIRIDDLGAGAGQGLIGYNGGALQLWGSGSAVSVYITEGGGVYTVEGSYSPTWTTSGSVQPNIGNGTLAGYYTKLGKRVDYKIDFTSGSTTTYGNGAWSFSAPVQAASTGGTSGTLYILDTSGTGINTGVGVINNSGTTVALYGGTSNMSNTNPFTWATGDTFKLNIRYWAAS